MSATRFVLTLAFASFLGLAIIWAQSPSAITDPMAILRALMQGVGVTLAAFYISIYLRTHRCGNARENTPHNNELIPPQTPRDPNDRTER